MLVPLISAVPLGAVSPPLRAKRAPGSRAFLNCCPFTETADEGTGLRRLTILLGMLVASFEPIDATLPDALVRVLFFVSVFAGRA